jgi:hypothetical protein
MLEKLHGSVIYPLRAILQQFLCLECVALSQVGNRSDPSLYQLSFDGSGSGASQFDLESELEFLNSQWGLGT